MEWALFLLCYFLVENAHGDDPKTSNVENIIRNDATKPPAVWVDYSAHYSDFWPDVRVSCVVYLQTNESFLHWKFAYNETSGKVKSKHLLIDVNGNLFEEEQKTSSNGSVLEETNLLNGGLEGVGGRVTLVGHWVPPTRKPLPIYSKIIAWERSVDTKKYGWKRTQNPRTFRVHHSMAKLEEAKYLRVQSQIALWNGEKILGTEFKCYTKESEMVSSGPLQKGRNWKETDEDDQWKVISTAIVICLLLLVMMVHLGTIVLIWKGRRSGGRKSLVVPGQGTDNDVSQKGGDNADTEIAVSETSNSLHVSQPSHTRNSGQTDAALSAVATSIGKRRQSRAGSDVDDIYFWTKVRASQVSHI